MLINQKMLIKIKKCKTYLLIFMLDFLSKYVLFQPNICSINYAKIILSDMVEHFEQLFYKNIILIMKRKIIDEN